MLDHALAVTRAGRHVTTLDRPEQLVVWALRRHAAAGRETAPLAAEFRRAFGLAVVESALAAFEAMAVRLSHLLQRPLLANRLDRDAVTPDEELVIALLAAAQARAGDGPAVAVLPMGRAARDAVAGFAAILAGAGLRLTPDHAPAAAPGGVAPVAGAAREPADLTAGERLALAGFRLWVARVRAEEPAEPALLRLLGPQGIPEAATSVHAAMSRIATAAMRMVDVRCPRCPGLSADEARLLAACAAPLHGRADLAEGALAEFLAPAAARLVAAPLAGLAMALGRAGHGLPLRPPPSSNAAPLSPRGVAATAAARPTIH